MVHVGTEWIGPIKGKNAGTFTSSYVCSHAFMVFRVSPPLMVYLVLLASTFYSIPFLPRYLRPQGRPFHIFFQKEEISRPIFLSSKAFCILGLIFYR